MSKCALITGGAGFIGSHLADVLLDRGWTVQILDDLSTGSLDNLAHLKGNPSVQVAIDTIFNLMVLDRLVSECDAVFHLAAAVGVELIVQQPAHTIRTNVEGSHNVLEAARRYNRGVLIASTSEVYGKGSAIPFREDDDTVSGPTTRHRWAYACSKAIDEFSAFAVAKESNLPVYIVRLFNTVGKRQSGRYGMVIPRFVRQALANEPISVYGSGDQSRCFTNVSDVTDALVNLVECPDAEGQVVNLGNEREISITNLAELIRKELNSDSVIEFIPYEEAYEAGFEDMHRRVPCLDKARRLIGYEPKITLEQTIQEVAEHLRAKDSEA